MQVLLPTQIIFSGLWLDNFGYLINDRFFCDRTCFILVQKLATTKKVTKVGKQSEKDDILTVQEK